MKTAKASGFSSVSEMLHVKGPSNITPANIQNIAVLPMKAVSPKKVCYVHLIAVINCGVAAKTTHLIVH